MKKSILKMWYLYLLYNSDANRTYIGITVDIKKRLRQHKGEIKGGAKFTTRLGNNWILKEIVSGFENRSEATRWEKLLKITARGLKQRLEAFQSLKNHIHPNTFSERQKNKFIIPSKIF